MKKTWLVIFMVFGLVFSMTAPSIYAAEGSKLGGLQKMLQKALGFDEDSEKYFVERDVKNLLIKIENKAKAEGADVEEYLSSAIDDLKDIQENIDLSAIDDLLGGVLGIGEDVEPQDEAETEEFIEMEGRTTPGPETVDVGDFTVDVPEGWLGIRDPSWDVEGEFETDQYYLVKGGQSSQDMQLGSPEIDIYYCDHYDADTFLETSTEIRDEVSELDVTLDGKDCTAVHAIMVIEEDSIETDMIFIPISDSSCVRVMVDTFCYGIETGLSANDSDVLAIINSIRIK